MLKLAKVFMSDTDKQTLIDLYVKNFKKVHQIF